MSVSKSQVGDRGTRGLFGAIVDYMDNVEISERVGKETLQYHLKVRILKLRLCRWYDRIAAGVGNKGGVEDNFVRAHLNSINLPSGEKVNSRTRDTSSSDNWMVREMDWLSQKHYSHSPRNSERRTLDANVLDNLIARIFSVAEKLEELVQPTQTGDSKDQLGAMRREDANHINGRSEANQTELQILENNAAEVDPEFASLVAIPNGHRYTDTRIEGKAITGDEFADCWGKGSIGNSHTYQSTTVTASGIAVVGNKYGGQSIFSFGSTSTQS
ncbi:hypothetical protein F4860DRAFT_321645 [Xylaria cubensis]|nr:hypothetical protein F4860DRAFT_321645 [Xylaria cubensis]